MDQLGPDDLDCLRCSHDDMNEYEDNDCEGPIPVARDLEITALVRRARDTDQIATLLALIERESDDEAFILTVYAGRMASLAARQNDPDLLRTGFLALAVAIRHEDLDPRDALSVQSLLWRGAQLLELDPAAELDRAAQLVPSSADFLNQWHQRTPSSQSIEAMGYRESDGPEGFRFRAAHFEPFPAHVIDELRQDFMAKHSGPLKFFQRRRMEAILRRMQEPDPSDPSTRK